MQIGSLFGLAVGVLLSGSALAQSELRRTETESVQNYKVARASYDKARKYFEKRDLEQAVKELEACLARVPEFSDAHFLLAKVDYLEKQYPDALQHMERAEASFDASNALYFKMQGDVLKDLQRRKDSQDVRIADLQDALRRATTDEQRSVLQVQIQQQERTRDELQRQLLAPPTEVVGVPADYPFFHGNILLRLNRLDDAAAQYREALRIKPTHADASNNLASLYLSAGHAQVAKEILDQAEANGATVNAELKKAVTEALQR